MSAQPDPRDEGQEKRPEDEPSTVEQTKELLGKLLKVPKDEVKKRPKF